MIAYVNKILCQFLFICYHYQYVSTRIAVGLDYLYLINIQSVQCVHHSPSALGLNGCTCLAW